MELDWVLSRAVRCAPGFLQACCQLDAGINGVGGGNLKNPAQWKPTKYVQTARGLRASRNPRQVGVSSRFGGGAKSHAVPDLFGEHSFKTHPYGEKRTGNTVVLFETLGLDHEPNPPNRLYVAPGPNYPDGVPPYPRYNGNVR